MANRLKKLMAPLLKEECNKAFQRGFEEGKQAGWDERVLSYENEIECLKTVIKGLEERAAPRFLWKDGEIIPLDREWTPVSKRLPEYKMEVLTHAKMGTSGHFYSVDELYMCDDEIGWMNEEGFIPQRAAQVTHWMPLPEPPKGE